METKEGSKNKIVKNLSNKEIVKLIREDIKHDEKLKGFKISVASDYLSIRVTIVQAPIKMRYEDIIYKEVRYTEQGKEAIQVLQNIVDSYNRSDKNEYTDLYNSDFYGLVSCECKDI